MSKLSLVLERIATDLQYLPITARVNYNVKKNERKKVLEKEKEKSKEMKKSEKSQDVCIPLVSSKINKWINETYGDICIQMIALKKASKSKDLANYALYYMQNMDAKLVDLERSEQEFVNGVAAIFEFVKIYSDAFVTDLRAYDPSYVEFIGKESRYLIDIEEVAKCRKLFDVQEKIQKRKAQLIAEGKYLETDVVRAEYLEEAFTLEQEERDNTMRVVSSASDRVDTASQNKYANYGAEGEKEVEYALKWLSDNYHVITRGESGITLMCPELTNEKQEIDHIVLGPQGVFLIETKYYTGKITIDRYGNWIREKNGTTEGAKNPLQQVERHHMVVEKILGVSDIHDVICIAHERSIIEGAENSPVPIIKVDMLAHYLKNFKNASGKIYTNEKIEELERMMNRYRV